MNDNCQLCETVQLCANQHEARLIHEFKNTYLLFGSHQFYSGYAVLIAKTHARELHHLPEEIRNGIWQELMQAGSAVEQVFKPWKLNYASYGNQVEHIHWHIFPRYEDDTTHLECPFVNSAKFVEYPTEMSKLISMKKELSDILCECHLA